MIIFFENRIEENKDETSGFLVSRGTIKGTSNKAYLPALIDGLTGGSIIGDDHRGKEGNGRKRTPIANRPWMREADAVDAGRRRR